MYALLYISSNATNAMINSSSANYTYVDKANKMILFVGMWLSGRLMFYYTYVNQSSCQIKTIKVHMYFISL